MALATQCPHCHTTFRVAHDQLKLRAGLVRCGACKQIFNGIENLLRPEELEPPSGPASSTRQQRVPPASPVTEGPSPQEEAQPASTADVIEEPFPDAPEQDAEDSAEDALPAPQPADEPEETQPAIEQPREDPLLRMTLMDFAHDRREPTSDAAESPSPEVTEGPDDVEQAIDDLNNKPWRRQQEEAASAEPDALDQADENDYVEPAFVRQGRRKERLGRILRIFMATASVILMLTALAQGTYVFRDRIAAWLPQTKPILSEACSYLGCQVGLPAQIEDVSIESSELQVLTANSNAFSLTVLLRNHGATGQAWPHIELTLNDNNETPIVRRVFSPREYLPTVQDVKAGFAARSEQPVKLFFELSQLKASGYRVYLFYP